MNKNAIVEAAREMRPRLEELLGTSDANKMGEAIDSLLVNVSGAEIDDSAASRLVDLLGRFESTRERLRERVYAETLRGFSPLPGPPRPVRAPRFVCPKCDFVWIRLHVAEAIPLCENCNSALIPAP